MIDIFCFETEGRQQTIIARDYGKKNNFHPKFPNMNLTSLLVPLLHTKFGNFKASLHSTRPCKGYILHILTSNSYLPPVIHDETKRVMNIRSLNSLMKILMSQNA